MPELIKIDWPDIPSQLSAKAGHKSARVMRQIETVTAAVRNTSNTNIEEG